MVVLIFGAPFHRVVGHLGRRFVQVRVPGNLQTPLLPDNLHVLRFPCLTPAVPPRMQPFRIGGCQRPVGLSRGAVSPEHFAHQVYDPPLVVCGSNVCPNGVQVDISVAVAIVPFEPIGDLAFYYLVCNVPALPVGLPAVRDLGTSVDIPGPKARISSRDIHHRIGEYFRHGAVAFHPVIEVQPPHSHRVLCVRYPCIQREMVREFMKDYEIFAQSRLCEPEAYAPGQAAVSSASTGIKDIPPERIAGLDLHV